MKKLIWFTIIVSLSFSCAKQSGGIFSSKKKQVIAQTDQLIDSLDMAWTNMTVADDQKIDNLGRLLKELSFTKDHDEERLDELLRMQKDLKDKRYSKNTMTSEEIDRYDLATDSLIRGTIELVTDTPEMTDHDITEPLLFDIKKADADLVLHRARYDRWAKKFNKHIVDHKDRLLKIGTPYDQLKPLPLFELSPN